MKAFFCFLSSFFLFISLPAGAVQWVSARDGFGDFPLQETYNQISWSAVGSVYQIGSLSNKSYYTYNANTYGCSGPSGWCPVIVKFAKIGFSGGVIQFQPSGTQPIGITTGNKCYITSATSIVGHSGGFGSNIHRNMQFTNTDWAINDTGWITVDGACRDLIPSSLSISQLSIIVPEIEGYMAMLVGGQTLAPRVSSLISNGDVSVVQYGFTSTANIKPISRIIACGEPKYARNTCKSSDFVYFPNAISPNIPNVTCDVSVPKEITISDVSTNDFIGKKGSDTIYAQCSSPTTISFQMSNNGTVNVGPFSVTTLIDNKSSPKIPIPENGKNINISAEIKGNIKTVEAGSYENTVIIIMTIS